MSFLPIDFALDGIFKVQPKDGVTFSFGILIIPDSFSFKHFSQNFFKFIFLFQNLFIGYNR